jgi:peptide/nickel transport system permease protein
MKRLRRFLRRPQNITGLLIVGGFIIIAATAPWLTPALNPESPAINVDGSSFDRTPHPPSATQPLGTLPGQIDVYHALIWGTRSAFVFGLGITFTIAMIGVVVGASSAYLGGRVNNLVMYITDAFLAFPLIAGVVLFNQLFDVSTMNIIAEEYYLPPVKSLLPAWFQVVAARINPLAIAFIFFSWMPYARLVNSVVLQVKQSEYLVAARAIGLKNSRIILRHVIPNSITPALVLAARDVGGIVLLQAMFTFIGLGGGSTWGFILDQGRNWIISPSGNMLAYWWVFVPATLALVLFGIGWNLLGDGLNDWLDPQNV